MEKLQLGESKISDAGIEYLKGMKKLRILGLNGTQISDAGLRKLQLQPHPNLNDLRIDHTRVSDTGLQYVAQMANLDGLVIFGTQITDAGLKNLCRNGPTLVVDRRQSANYRCRSTLRWPAFQACILNLESNQISDEGLRCLRGLKYLADVTLYSDRITDAGLEYPGYGAR